MLLRLLPAPTAAQPTPPTILFTLPLPTHPYTGRSLPLPPNLLAHRSVCLQEDIECPNVLLGEKSSWISGIIDDVTFSLPTRSVAVNLIDASVVKLELTDACEAHLKRVCKEVELSFTPAPEPEEVRRASTSSNASTCSFHSTSGSAGSSSSAIKPLTIAIPSPPSSPTARRSPSALLYSLISPLFPTNTQSFARQQAAPNPSRAHRRAARSLLVDTYRRFVLPALKVELHSSYLPWAIASETNVRMQEFEKLKTEMEQVLSAAGVDRTTVNPQRPSLQRNRSSSSGSDLTSMLSFESDIECPSSPYTPATSVFSSGSSLAQGPSPQTFLLSIPPAHQLPTPFQSQYSHQLQRLTSIASRLNSIKKLNLKYEREEGKRRWLEDLERGRLGDRALKKAYSNGQLRGKCVSAEPRRASRLWRSWSAEDEEREANKTASVAVHPAMMDDSHDDVDMGSDSGASDEENMPITPRSLSFARDDVAIRSPSDSCLPISPEDVGTPCPKTIYVRPILCRTETVYEDEEPSLEAPPLEPSKSGDSLSSIGSWDQETEDEVDDLERLKLSPPVKRRLPPSPTFADSPPPLRFSKPLAVAPPPLPPKPTHRILAWARAAYADEVMA